jgi:hypothetical protein
MSLGSGGVPNPMAAADLEQHRLIEIGPLV